MNYLVKFNFNCINNKSLISGKSGEVEITSDASIEELKNSKELPNLIALDMANKTKQSIISVDITDISLNP